MGRVIQIEEARNRYYLGEVVRGCRRVKWSNLNKKIYTEIEEWRYCPIEGKHPYL